MAEEIERGAADAYTERSAVQFLRRAAGFTRAEDFAQVIHIPPSTYRRYEQCAPTPDTAIPITPAWIIADFLNCSIDEVVGRTQPGTAGAGFQRTYNRLSVSSQELLDEYMGFLMYRDRLLQLNPAKRKPRQK